MAEDAVALIGGMIGMLLLAGAVYAEERPSPMTQARMEAIIRDVAGTTRGQPGFVQFDVDGMTLACISDVRHDRMRLIAPVVKTADLTTAHIERILDAQLPP